MSLNGIKTRLDEILREKIVSIMGWEDIAYEKVVNLDNELASRLREEFANKDNELANSLLQEVLNRDNELASIWRREDEQWAIMMRQEMDLLRKEIHQIGNQIESTVSQTRLLFARENWKNRPRANPLPTLLKNVEDFFYYLLDGLKSYNTGTKYVLFGTPFSIS